MNEHDGRAPRCVRALDLRGLAIADAARSGLCGTHWLLLRAISEVPEASGPHHGRTGGPRCARPSSDLTPPRIATRGSSAHALGSLDEHLRSTLIGCFRPPAVRPALRR